MPTEIQHVIGGQFVAGKSGRTAPVYNSANGEQQGVVPLASAAEVDQAVALARAAFPKWAMTTPLRRARIPNRFLRLLEEHQ
jgi:malonate-semialdehyde dehydrogenase (acetylating) / methylmalonate-semialdehyde dehydrogenase